MLRSVTFSAAIATMVIATPALASAPSDFKTAQVRYHDLDLSTSAGVESLNRRVRQAAEDVCDKDDAWKSRRLTAAQICMRVAMTGAKPQVNKAIAMYGKTIRRAEATTITVVS